MFPTLLLLLPLALAAPHPDPKAVVLTKEVKAASPYYSPPVYNEHTGQGLSSTHGGLNLGHGGLNLGYGVPSRPGHVYTGYPSYPAQNQHTHYPSHGHYTARPPTYNQPQYTGHYGHGHLGSYNQNQYVHANQYLNANYPSLGLKTPTADL